MRREGVHHMRTDRRALAAALFLTASGCSAEAADPSGVWLSQDRDAHVSITSCGSGWCGRIVWLRDPNDPDTGRPWTDKANSDARLRTRPVLGLPSILDMKPGSKPNHWDGKVYDPRRGNTYSGSLTLEGPSRLKVEGCLLLICESEIMTRLPAAPPQPPRP